MDKKKYLEELRLLGEEVQQLEEKNCPTNPSKWSYYKSQAKQKFDVYPSAYANGWASKQYKAAGGGWKQCAGESVNEASVSDFEIGDFVHFKSKNKTGMVVSVKGNKVTINTPKGKITSDVKDVKVLHQDNVNEAYVIFYAKKKGDKPSQAAYRDKDMAVKFEKDLKKDGYITMMVNKKIKGVDESVTEDENDPQEIKVGNYQTKYFHVCPGASTLYKDIESKGVDMDMAERSVRLQDALFFIEEHIQRDGYDPEKDYVMVAKNIAKNIMKLAKMMDLEEEHNYIQGHIDTIEKVVHDESVNESASRTAMEIGGYTGLNKNAVQKFVDDNNLDIEKLFQYVKKGKLPQRMELVSAIAGRPNNPVQKKMIKMFSEGMVAPKQGHYYYQLTKDTPIKYIKSQSNPLGATGVLWHNNDAYIDGKKGAYLIDYFGALYYVDMKKKVASSVYPLRDQDKFNKSSFTQVDKAPEHSDWKKYIKESTSETLSKGKTNKSQLKELIREEYHNVKNFMEEKYGFTPELGKVIDNPYVTAFSSVNEGFQSEYKGNDGIIWKKGKTRGGVTNFTPYYKGHDIDKGGYNFKTEKELKDFIKDYILSNQLYNKYRFEGSESDADMAVDQLETSIRKAQQLIDKLRGKSNLEPWVQSLITKAEDYLSTVSDYGEIEEYDVENYQDIQEFAEFMENYKPSLNEAEYQGRKVELGKIMQGDVKKFKVYVNNDKGNVVKVNFGQGGGAKGGTMRIRKDNPEARKSFRARHNCDNPGPRWKARYWSCKKW